MRNEISRRGFIRQGVTLTALSAMGSAVQAGPFGRNKDILPLIDTHQHLWDLTRYQPPWINGAPEILNRSYITKDYNAATRGLNLVKAVYMEVDVDPADQIREAEHVIALSRSSRYPTVAAVISGRPDEDSFDPYIRKFKDSPYIKGVRQVLHPETTPQGLCLGKTFVKSMHRLGEQGMSFDLCMRPTELTDGAKLADQAPDTLFIVDHCGNGDPKAFLKNPAEAPTHKAQQWKQDMAELAKRDNVICKISGIVVRAPQDHWTPDMLAPLINHCLDTFGPDRVVFGGDWPVCRIVASYRQWVHALKTVIANRPREQQRKLLHDNADRIYGLS